MGGRERDGQTDVGLLFQLLMLSLVLPAWALTRDRTHNIGVLGQCSNQLSYPARANKHLEFLRYIFLIGF